MLSLDFLRRARRVLFVQINTVEFLMIAARHDGTEVSWWVSGQSAPIRIHQISISPEYLGLFDGRAWNLLAVIHWTACHCPVCWKPLGSTRQTYDTNACKQRAYRERKKVMQTRQNAASHYQVLNRQTGQEVEGVMVLIPESDLHARRAILAYAESLDFEDPLKAEDLRGWVHHLNMTVPIRTRAYSENDIPDWLLHQTASQSDK